MHRRIWSGHVVFEICKCTNIILHPFWGQGIVTQYEWQSSCKQLTQRSSFAATGRWFGAAVALLITWMKLLNVEPSYYWDGWPSLGGYITPQYETRPTMSTHPCIPLGLLNWVPALTGWGRGGNVTSARWQVTVYMWSHVVCEFL